MTYTIEALTTEPAGPSAPPVARPREAVGVPASFAEILAGIVQADEVSIDSNFFDDLGADSMVMARFCARVRKRADLPPVSMTDVYRHPTLRRLATALTGGPSELERSLADVLAEIVQVEQVSPESNFFDDLGADSMVMARFCARVRKRADLPSISMKEIYLHPTLGGLAAALATPDTRRPVVTPAAPAPVEVTHRAGTLSYVGCGALQFLIFLGYSYLLALVITRGTAWVLAAPGLIDTYLRSVAFGSAGFLGLCLVPILAKWLLIGRWKRRQIRIWSLDYVRFWTVKTLVRSNPLVLFAGTPLYTLYLRALGAKVGRGVAVLSRNPPICTDLVTIGSGTVIRQDCFFNGYRAHAGLIQTGQVTFGENAFVGDASILDIDTALGDGAQLGRSSALHSGQSVPAGRRWHGSPAQPTDVDYRTVEPARCGRWRRISYTGAQLFNLLVVTLPLGVSMLAVLLAEVPQLAALLRPEPLALTDRMFYLEALAASAVLFFGALIIGLVLVAIVPRLLNLALTPDRVYPLYGFHYGLQRAIGRLTNIKMFTRLFGDSSAITGYLRYLGVDLSHVVQSGSNFGTDVRQHIPYLSTVGSGTMVADGLSLNNTDFSSTSFRVSRVSIGDRNFLGNRIIYPPQGRTGDNCLLATKVMVPIDGKVREGVGLLGSPAFEIPRSVARDSRFDSSTTAAELPRLLRAKNRHNVATMGIYLLSRWLFVFLLLLLAGVAIDLYDVLGPLAIAVDIALTPVITVAYYVLVERAHTVVHRLQPRYCSIYDRAFWRHERYWKVPSEVYLQVFNGTPFKNVVWRMLGVRLGRRVFDDGLALTERTLTTIGDDCTFNVGSVIQCHSQEDGAFKCEPSTIGDGCTLGVGAFVHYGVTMGNGAVLAPDSFLMKGEEVPAHARWGGNPARELPQPAPAHPALRPGRWSTRWPAVINAAAALATLPILASAPQIAPAVWAGLLDRLAVAAADIRNADSALAGLAVAQAVLLLLPLLGIALLVIALGRMAGRVLRRPPSTTGPATEPAPTAPVAGVRNARTVLAFSTVAAVVTLFFLLAAAGLDKQLATAGEATLAAGAALHPGSVLAPLWWPDTVAALQLAMLDVLVSTPGNQDVADNARIAMLVAGLVGCLLLWPVARRLRLSTSGAALAVALGGLTGLTTGLFGSVDAGTLAALWLIVAVALAGRGGGASLAALAAAVLAALTVPLAAVAPLVLAGHSLLTGAFDTRWRPWATRAVGVLLIAAAGLLALQTIGLGFAGAGQWTGSGRGGTTPEILLGVLAVGAVVLRLAWARMQSLRPVVSATAGVLACAAAPGPHVVTALLLVIPALAVLAAATIDELVLGAPLRHAALAAVLLGGTAAAGPLIVDAVAVEPDRAAVTTWIRAQLDPAVALRVDPLTAAQLIRDGIPADRLIPPAGAARPGTVSVIAVRPDGSQVGPPRGTRVLFESPHGAGGGPTYVVSTDPQTGNLAELQLLESRLAGNPALTLALPAAEALRSGAVDMRLATALSGLTVAHRLTIDEFAAVPGEPADAPRRIAVISAVDGASTSITGITDVVRQWLSGQPPNLRPVSTELQGGKLVVHYATPSPPPDD